MPIQLWLLVPLYAAALAFLLWTAARRRALYPLGKGICSALFLLCAVLAFFAGPRAGVTGFVFMLVALALCAVGDTLLGFANRTEGTVEKGPFMAGAVAFSLAHVGFCIFFFLRAAFAWYDLLFPLALWVILFFLERGDRIRLGKLRPVGYFYTFLVGLMMVKAAGAMATGGAPGQGGILLLLGAALFFLSDYVLLFLYFGTVGHSWQRPANLISYYAGIFLMALSLYWF